jgi:tRNA threonylcarbamoyladenosine biosynthesis protein TsaE
VIIHSASPDTTRALGASLAQAILKSSLEAALVIALNGELGAGKTTFVGGLLCELGNAGPVRSPTYTLIELYEVRDGLRISHLDLYRLADASELEMLAPRDLLEPRSILLVEWAERGGRALPMPDLSLTFSYPQSGGNINDRTIKIELGSSAGKVLGASLHALSNETRLSP